jgi:alpha-tubulin suppressor-like RCC1 family protein
VWLGDCDGDPENGCETFLPSSRAHCGACGRACAIGEACLGGACVPRPVELATGHQAHSCALLPDRTLRCWGPNDHAQLGDGTTQPRALPVPVVGLTDVDSAAVGGDRTCAIRRGGAVWCWGAGEAAPREVAGVSALALAVAVDRTCALLTGGRIACWQPGEPPTTVAGIDDAAVIAAAGRHVCVLRRIGQVACWGDNPSGVLGGPGADSREPIQRPLYDLVALDTGAERTCVVGRTGIADCWGDSLDGSGMWALDVVAVATGRRSTAGLVRDGRVAVWGDGIDGSLGNGYASRVAPGVHQVSGLERITQIVSGAHTCAASGTGQVSCWGANTWGALGGGETTVFPSPMEVPGIGDAVRVVAGSSYTCALRRSGRVACWGRGFSRSLRSYDPTRPERAFEPADVPGVDRVVSLVGGNLVVCARPADGQSLCFHGGRFPPFTASPVPSGSPQGAAFDGFGPRALPKGRAPVGFAMGERVVAEVDRAGKVSVTFDADRWVDLPGLTSVASVSWGNWWLYAVARSGAVTCVRGPYEAAGVGIAEVRPLAGVGDAVAVAASHRAGAYILRRGGSLWFSPHGAPNNGTCGGPIERVDGIDDAVEVASSVDSACVRLGSGAVVCWGSNEHGQLGGGVVGAADVSHEPAPHKRPTRVVGLSDAVSISVGKVHACAVRRTGTVVCWGSNEDDQAGQRDRPVSYVPVHVGL